MGQTRSRLSCTLSSRLRPGPWPHAALFLALVTALVSVALPAAAQSRGLEPVSDPGAPAAAKVTYYALVIGINDYPQPLPKLKTAVNDAKSVGAMLHDRFGFHVTYLLDQNATRFNILDALSKYRNTLTENDNLLIYYAGHGYSDRDAEKAYWLPADADSSTSPNRIIADDLTTGVRVLASRHVLIISDSCYSGALTRDADAPVPSNGQAAFLARMLRARSRTLMASGGDEPVADSGSNGHSVFAFAVLDALAAEDQPVFTASDLFYRSVRQQVAGRSEQMPQYSIIRNSDHEEGDFVFTRTGTVAPPATPANPHLVAAPPASVGHSREADIASPPAPSRDEAASAAPTVAVPPSNTDAINTSAMSPQFAFGRAQDLSKDRRYGDAAQLDKFACEGGVMAACTDLGWFAQGGLGMQKDDRQAVSYFRKSCDGGNMRGCNDLASMHENGWGVQKDVVEAVELYRKACEGKDGMGCKNLGDMAHKGSGMGKDDVQSATFYRTACDLSFGNGCTALGTAYSNGQGVAKDFAQAATLYRKACDMGDGEGCNALGGLYLNGNGLAKDESQTATLAQRACQLGYAIGCKNLGWLYLNGRGVQKDDARANAEFVRACDGGNSNACTMLGDSYVNGRGVEKDPAHAADLYRKACDSGDPEGCNELGGLYFNGNGVTKDEAQTVAFARRACDGGNLQGCVNLGWMYETGRSVAKDSKQAEELYHKACEGGFQKGCDNLKTLQSTPSKPSLGAPNRN